MQEASGFLWTDHTSADDGTIESYQTAFRFLVKETSEADKSFVTSAIHYTWHKLGFFTFWRAQQGSIVLCFDLPALMKDSIRRSLLELNPPSSFNLTPFAMHTFVLEQIVALYNTALWSARDLVRKREQSRPTVHNPQPDYSSMHELARHAIHSSEMLSMAIEVVSSMARENDVSYGEVQAALANMEVGGKRTGQVLRYYITLLKSLHFRSQALESRLGN